MCWRWKHFWVRSLWTSGCPYVGIPAVACHSWSQYIVILHFPAAHTDTASSSPIGRGCPSPSYSGLLSCTGSCYLPVFVSRGVAAPHLSLVSLQRQRVGVRVSSACRRILAQRIREREEEKRERADPKNSPIWHAHKQTQARWGRTVPNCCY